MRSLTLNEINHTSGASIPDIVFGFAAGTINGLIIAGYYYTPPLEHCQDALLKTIASFTEQLDTCHAENAVLLAAANSTNSTI